VNKTRWFQPGQVTQQLHYVRLEVADGCEIQNIRHSLFGETQPADVGRQGSWLRER